VSNKQNKIILDLDGVLAEIDLSLDYKDRKVNKSIKRSIIHAKSNGYCVTLFSARNMRTYNGDIKKINDYTRPIIEQWLKDNKIEVDDLILGKPWNGPEGFYVDDNNLSIEEFTFRFDSKFSKYSFDVIVPFYNEEKNIQKVFEDVVKVKRFLNIGKFIFIDNGSTDSTRSIIQDIVRSNKDVEPIYIDTNKGYGFGMKEGIKKSNSSFFITLHGDYQFKLYEFFVVNYDFLKSIDPKDANIFSERLNRSFFESLMTKTLRIFLALVLKKKVGDFNGQPKILQKLPESVISKAPNDYTLDMYLWIKNSKSSNIFLKSIQHKRYSGSSSWKGLDTFKIALNFIKTAFR